MKKKHARVDVEIDAEMVADGVKSLSKELAKVSDWSRSDSHDVERAMSQVTRWTKELSILKQKVYSMKKTTSCYELDDTEYLRCDSIVTSLETELEVTVEALEHEDEVRCLYSLNKSNTATVKYPVFSGGHEEDYFRFEKEMRSALKTNRVRYESQVDVLRDNLKGGALRLIPSHMTSQC